MTDGGDLPWEITEIIFQYMSLDALRNAALASKVFHEEARKYMFQGVTLTVNFHNALVLHYLKSKERPDLDEIQEKLVFFTSDPIHQFVRSCRILYVAPDPGSEALVDALCAQLSHFPKLQSLYLDSTNITSERAEGISRCTSLLSIFLVNCSSPPITRPLRHTVSAPSLYIQKDVGRPQKWLSLMNLDTLSHLQLETPSAALDALEEMTAFEATSITSIAIDGDESVVRADTLSTAISKCPHLTKLKVLTPSRNVSLHPLPEDVVLSKFDGPQDMLKSVLANQKNLRRVRLNGSRWSNTCDTFDIRLQLPLLQTHAPNLESLQLRAFPTAYLCNLIATSFPNLQALSFELPLQTQKEEPMQALTREVRPLFMPDVYLPLLVALLSCVAAYDASCQFTTSGYLVHDRLEQYRGQRGHRNADPQIHILKARLPSFP